MAPPGSDEGLEVLFAAAQRSWNAHRAQGEAVPARRTLRLVGRLRSEDVPTESMAARVQRRQV